MSPATNKKNQAKAEKVEKDVPEPESENEEEDDENVDPLDQLDLTPAIYRRAKFLRALYDEQETVDEEYLKARIELEKTFLAKKNELYAKRQNVISGAVDVPKLEGEAEDTDNSKGIPGFWMTVLTSHPIINSLMNEEDTLALEALSDLSVEIEEDFTAFTLVFTFDENEYFENKVLKKKYYVEPHILDEVSPTLTKIDCDEIKWKAGKNLTVEEISKKQKAKSGRNKGQVRTVVKTVPKASFFNFFKPRSPEEEGEDDEEEDDENADGPIKLTLDEDYDIGHTIRTVLIPEAILWFSGEQEYDFDQGDFEEDDEEGEGEDEEDDEDDDEEEVKKAPKGKGNKQSAPFNPAAGGAAGQQPECKQS